MKFTISICVVLLFGVGASSATAGWTTLDMPGATETYAYGIDGTNIVGAFSNNSGTHGFLYNGATWTTLDMPGAAKTYVYSISGNNIVGQFSWDNASVPQGFFCSETSLTSLNILSSGVRPYSISGGMFVGVIYDASGTHGFFHTIGQPPPPWTTIDMPGALATEAYGTDGSNIVGYYSWNNLSAPQGFLWDGATYTTIDMPGAGTYPHGIDGSNIVGVAQNASGMHGFLYDGTTWTTIDMPEALATEAYGISGNNIVGYYQDATGNTHGFIYTIPEPATLTLLAFGGLALIGHKYKRE